MVYTQQMLSMVTQCDTIPRGWHTGTKTWQISQFEPVLIITLITNLHHRLIGIEGKRTQQMKALKVVNFLEDEETP